MREAAGPGAQGGLSWDAGAAAVSEPDVSASQLVVTASDWDVLAAASVVPPALVSGCPGSLVVGLGSVGSVGGAVELVEVVELVELLLEVVGGSVVLVGGGSVLGATVLLGWSRRRDVVEAGAWVVEVLVWLLRVRIAAFREPVVGAAVEVAPETRWRCWCVVVVVVCREIASATWRGDVARPTTVPPTAPSSTATTTLTHRRSATNATGLNRRTPPVRRSPQR